MPGAAHAPAGTRFPEAARRGHVALPERDGLCESAKTIHRFDVFELDTDRHELRRDGAPVAIEPQVFALLAVLVENRHRMVSRDELIALVWEGRIVSDSAVSSRIKTARRALGDDGDRQQWIRTVHGRGFRFVGDVASEAPVLPATPRAWSDEVLARPILAVLPFVNEGGRAEDDWFIEGFADELIAELASWRWFPVLSRSTSFASAAAHAPAAARASGMGARYVITGRFQRAGEAARLALELVDAATDTALGSASFPCHAQDAVALEDEIARQVFRRIAPELTSAETRRVLRKPPAEWSAWDLTLKGLWHLHRATPHDFSESLRYLGDATHADPGFALPWSLLALTRYEMGLKGWTSTPSAQVMDLFRQMLQAASTAVELDPTGWMGHALKSAGELWTNLAFPLARVHADRAIELNPSASMAYHFSGCLHGFAGDLPNAIATAERAFRIDPSDTHADVVETDLGLWYLLAGELDAAGAHLTRALELNPGNIRAWQRRIAWAGLAGDRDAARAALAAHARAGGSLAPDYLRASYPFHDPAHAEAFRQALRRAGVDS